MITALIQSLYRESHNTSSEPILPRQPCLYAWLTTASFSLGPLMASSDHSQYTFCGSYTVFSLAFSLVGGYFPEVPLISLLVNRTTPVYRFPSEILRRCRRHYRTTLTLQDEPPWIPPVYSTSHRGFRRSSVRCCTQAVDLIYVLGTSPVIG
jgi:hypothetical protein